MSPAFALPRIEIEQHVVGDNVWLRDRHTDAEQELMTCVSHALNHEVLESEEVVGQAMFAELKDAAARTAEDLTVVILGGRGGQALHRLLGEKAKTDEIDDLLGIFDRCERWTLNLAIGTLLSRQRQITKAKIEPSPVNR